VNVVEKGTSNGTVTDMDGNYSLKVSADATIVFSYIGFQNQEVKWNGENPLDIVMQEDSELLSEVVVTAIGIKQSKRKIGYSTQQIKNDVLELANPINVGSALSGQVAGLRITNPTGIFQQPELILRGNKPLIVVDGIPMQSDLFDVSSSNIENINVLKGTSASALYGSRGKNGAIIITTKNASKDGLNIDVNLSSMMTAGYTVFPETQTEYGSGSQGQYEFWDGADGGISDGDMTWGPKFTPGLLVKQWNSPIRNKQTGEEIPWWGDVSGSIYDNRSLYERVPIPFVQHDNLKDYMRTGVVSQGNVSIASKGTKANTFLSINFAHQKGQVPNTSLTSGGLLLNYDVNLVENLLFSFNATYNKVFSPNYPRYGYGPKNHMYTILLWMSDDVDLSDLRKHMYRPDMDGYRQANYNYAWYNNPYFMAYEATQLSDRNVLNGQVKLLWNVLPKVSIQGRASARTDSRFEDRKVPKSYMNYGDSRLGDYKNWNTHDMDINADVLITYKDEFNENLGTELNVGSSTFYKKNDQQYQSTDGLIVPRVYSLSNTSGPVIASNYLSEKAINSIYASLNIDVFHSTYITFTGRNDWASTLPKQNNSYFYPSVSLSNILSDYIRFPELIDFLKIYGSWATVSNDLDPYRLNSVYNNGTMFGTNQSVYYPENLVNPFIEPEKTTSYEVGISTAFAKNRINFEATYFHNKDENQIINLPISEASGFTSRLINGNIYTTNGFEIMVGAIISNSKIRWNSNFNFSGQSRILSEIYDNQKKYGNLKVGDRADALYATVWQKNATGQLILDSKGMPIRDPYPHFVGNQLPDYLYGWQNTLEFDGLRINIDFDGAIGGTLISTTHQKMWWAGKHPKSTAWRDAEYEQKKPVYVPEGVVVTGGELKRDIDGNVISDTRTFAPNKTAVNWQSWSQNYPYRAVVLVEESEEFANTFDTSFLKLRRLAVTYDVNRFLKWPGINAIDLTLFGNNLFVLKNIPYLDPDFGSKDNDLQDPSARYIGVNASIKF
jgi:TonB-linked SusC/RagA family outer membrane protein